MSQEAQAQPVEYKNERIHAVMLPKEACRIEFRVKAFGSLIESARREALKAVGKEVLLPGFRKGRAPDEMIRKKFPKEVEKELHNKLADAAFAETQRIAKIPILNRNAPVTFDLKSLTDEVAELIFSFETEPQVPSVAPKRFLPKPVARAEVGEKQIDEAIRQMQYYFAEWKPVIDRPIQEKDTILIDLDTIDESSPQRVFNQMRFEVSRERMAEWMQKLVLGAKAGELLEGISEPDANATEEEKKEFAPKKVRIAILKVEEALLPELNEAFAKKVGARDPDHMRQTVADMLGRQADEKARDLLREQVNDFLVEQYPFELPQSLVKTEKDHRFRQLSQNPNFKRDWDKMSQEERKTFEATLSRESEGAMRLFYLSRQVVNDAKLGITHQEVQDVAIATMKTSGSRQMPVDQIPKEVYALAVSKVLLAKAQDFILSQSTNEDAKVAGKAVRSSEV